MKKTNKTADGTSFHGVTIKTTINKLMEAIGDPDYFENSGNKVSVEWVRETALGHLITIYDWKEYRVLGLNEEVEFHLGGQEKDHTLTAKEELELYLNK
jgi:hypothetical protein